jgi:hypothetical protein
LLFEIYRSVQIAPGKPAIFGLRRLIGNCLWFKLSPVQQLSQLKTLDDLMAQAGQYAEFCMPTAGRWLRRFF